ncbi:MAG: chemotaxis response regulator protein-glutamate methylesterase [Anaerolineales bacterium]|nr:chemotaxis response regulator protein-glutamate methylesterase [Anaerolineales bacterium]
MREIRVLVVDDSAFLRRNLPRILESDPTLKVVGTAANGAEAIQKIKELRPDVVTLDVLMPVMDGLTALKHIMRETPTPVIMVSSVTREGAQETLEAPALGAIDFVAKPSGPVSLDIEKVRGELVKKIKIAYTTKIKVAASVDVTRSKFRAIVEELSKSRAQPVVTARPEPGAPGGKRLVAIAASTGGPAALQLVLGRLPQDLNAGIVIVQHIAAGFTRPLAERLNSLSQINVREAEDGAPVTPGVALISPAQVHITTARKGNRLVVRLSPEPANTIHRPSANVLFHSIAGCCAAETCAVILTGMGDDGALGMRSIHEGSGWTVAQDEASSVIYGMPRKAVELGGVAVSLSLDRIPAEIVRATA